MWFLEARFDSLAFDDGEKRQKEIDRHGSVHNAAFYAARENRFDAVRTLHSLRADLDLLLVGEKADHFL